MKLVNVMASSLDGRIGISSLEGDELRQIEGISSAEDQAHLRKEIGNSDGIIVGASSIRANKECLLHDGLKGVPPTWYILTNSPIPSHYPFWRQSQIKRVILSEKKIPIFNDQVVFRQIQGNVAKFAYDTAKIDGCSRVLLFGGGIINSWFYEEDLVDELVLTLAPKLVASSSAPFLLYPSLTEPVRLKLVSSHAIESFVFLKYVILK